jgi:opacity protein-like surface antigen
MINAKSRFDWSVAMRRFFLAAVMMGAVSTAHAADLPVLRGGITDPLSSTSVNWQGFYVGGQGGYGSSDTNLSGSNSDLAAAAVGSSIVGSQMGVAQWSLPLDSQSSRTVAYGGFAGYNWQWTDAVLSFEASYLHGKFGDISIASQSVASPSRLSDNLFHFVTATSSSSIAISDMATIRGRAAYAFGCFLPYAFAGVALGNANISRIFTAQDSVGTVFLGGYVPLQSFRASNGVNDHLIYGYAGGLGMDVDLTAGFFLRAEWEYLRFTSSLDTSINTVRGGLGYKF